MTDVNIICVLVLTSMHSYREHIQRLSSNNRDGCGNNMKTLLLQQLVADDEF